MWDKRHFKKCGTTDVLDGTEDDVLFEECEWLDNNNSNDECDRMTEISESFITSINFILHCHFVEYICEYELKLCFKIFFT
jgi:hypothetical protein